MFYALNKDGIRIDAYEADKNEQYTCPICNNRVILKRGSVNIDHFAHEANVCEDTWNYDMSEWHKRMQNYFPRESQEVVVSHKGRKHRADVLIGDIVLEFQYSPITAAEFDDRNEFFKNAGYRLAWVFNLSQISEDNLYVILKELIEKIEVYHVEGSGKNKTQRIVIHYRFVGCLTIPEWYRKRRVSLESRSGVEVNFLTTAV